MSVPARVHFVAIGGTGMGSLAGLLHARGVHVTGSDEPGVHEFYRRAGFHKHLRTGFAVDAPGEPAS